MDDEEEVSQIAMGLVWVRIRSCDWIPNNRTNMHTSRDVFIVLMET